MNNSYHAIIAQQIMQEDKFLTIRDNEEIYYYHKGYFHPYGETYLKELIQNKLKSATTTTMVNEIIAYIKRETYTDREELNSSPPNYINTANGVYDIEKEKLLPHAWNYCFTWQIPINYNPNANTPKKIIKFLKETVNQNKIRTALEAIAYTIYPDNHLQKAFMLVGNGRNGKSTYLDLIIRFLGEDNTTHIELQALEEDKFMCGQLFGKLLNSFADLPSKALTGTGIFKSITGRDRIKGEHKGKNPFFFRPYAKLFFSANMPPRLPEDSDAIYRRWLLLPFPNQFEGSTDDKNKLSEITTRSELEGLLFLCLRILPKLLQRGRFSQQQSIQEIRDQYTRLSDPIGSFIMDCVVSEPGEKVVKSKLYESFIIYCREHHYPYSSEKMFSIVLKKTIPVGEAYVTEYVGESDAKRQVWHWEGIGLREKGGMNVLSI